MDKTTTEQYQNTETVSYKDKFTGKTHSIEKEVSEHFYPVTQTSYDPKKRQFVEETMMYNGAKIRKPNHIDRLNIQFDQEEASKPKLMTTRKDISTGDITLNTNKSKTRPGTKIIDLTEKGN